MTPKERENPDLINISRKQRIAKGSGRDMTEINLFIKQFEEMRKMMHKVSKMPNMGGGPGFAAAAHNSKKKKR